jgi:hypothetical protein
MEDQAQPEWFSRLVAENDELVVRLTKLRAFMQTEQFRNLDIERRYLMTTQAVCMASLNGCLENRIALGF